PTLPPAALAAPPAGLAAPTHNNPHHQHRALPPPMVWGNPEVPPPPNDAAEALKVLEYQQTWGVHPGQAAYHGHHYWSIYLHVTDPFWQRVVHGGVLVSMFLFTIGFCTRIAAVLTWLGLLSYVNRGVTSLFGMDQIMIVVVLYLMIAPSGAALSVDRLIARWRVRRGKRPAELPPPEPSVSANLALRLLQIHVCIIYMASGLSKLQGASWWGGTA